MQNLDEQLPLLYMLNYTLNRMTDVLESVCCWAKPAVVFGCQTEYSRRLAMSTSEKGLGNQAWMCFHLCEGIDKSFLTDCSATLAVMLIDKAVYSQSITPIVPYSSARDWYKYLITTSGLLQWLKRNEHMHAHTHISHFLPPQVWNLIIIGAHNHFFSNLETHTCLTTTASAAC